MKLTEIIEKYGGETDAETLDFIEAVLLWKSQNAGLPPQNFLNETIKKLANVCKKNVNVQSLEKERQSLVDEISRLNISRQKLTAMISDLNEKRSQNRKEYETAEQQLREKQETLNELERIKNEIEHLPDEQLRLEKEIADLKAGSADAKRKYDATKQLLDELKQNHWLVPNVKDSITKIWKSLPSDEIDEAVENVRK